MIRYSREIKWTIMALWIQISSVLYFFYILYWLFSFINMKPILFPQMAGMAMYAWQGILMECAVTVYKIRNAVLGSQSHSISTSRKWCQWFWVFGANLCYLWSCSCCWCIAQGTMLLQNAGINFQIWHDLSIIRYFHWLVYLVHNVPLLIQYNMLFPLFHNGLVIASRYRFSIGNKSCLLISCPLQKDFLAAQKKTRPRDLSRPVTPCDVSLCWITLPVETGLILHFPCYSLYVMLCYPWTNFCLYSDHICFWLRCSFVHWCWSRNWWEMGPMDSPQTGAYWSLWPDCFHASLKMERQATW